MMHSKKLQLDTLRSSPLTSSSVSFLKMVASGPEQSVVNFSLRFTLTHMTGSFSPKVMDGIRSVLDSSDYSAELRKRQIGPGGVGGGVDDPDVTAEATGQFTVPYAMQTGPMRYAPMPKKPGSTIPSRSPSRQYPTSAYDIATTYLPKPTVEATVTAPLTYSTSSIENTVCIQCLGKHHTNQPHRRLLPQNQMQK